MSSNDHDSNGTSPADENRNDSVVSQIDSQLYHQGSPQSLPSFSPASRRRRLRNVSKRNIEILLGTSPPSAFVTPVLHVPRDPIQPRSGSISDVHSEASEEAEIDFFPDDPPCATFRPRSQTCPENRSWLRRARVRSRNRPPTPPPGGADDTGVEGVLATHVNRDKLRVSNHTLPLAIPENPDRDRNAELSNGDVGFREDEIFEMDA